ncbi:MAG: hypothetical protein K0S80_4645 [Neobacillus sp.]|nr:hypothetical protein [Neobacillus sp.]
MILFVWCESSENFSLSEKIERPRGVIMKKANKFPILIAIILICLAPMADTYILIPAMANIAAAFPNVSGTLINLIMTISSLTVIPTSLIVGKVVGDGKLNKKTALLIGFILFTIGGTAGGLFVNIYWILFTMAIKGIGNGFAMAMVVTVTADYFFGQERANVMGIYNAVGSAIAIVITIVAGYVAVVNWRLTFLLYLICGLVVVYHAFVLEKNPPKSPEALAEEEAEKKEMEAALTKDSNHKPSLGRALWILVFITFISQIVANTLYVTLSMFIEGEKIGNAAATGYVNALLTVAIVVCSLAFGIIYSKCKRFTTTIFFLLLGAGFFALAYAQSLQMAIVATIVWGVGYGMTIPYIYQEATILPPKSLVTVSGALINSVIFGSYFLSAFLPQVITSIFNNGSVRFLYIVLAAIMGICAIIVTIYFIVCKKDRRKGFNDQVKITM